MQYRHSSLEQLSIMSCDTLNCFNSASCAGLAAALAGPSVSIWLGYSPGNGELRLIPNGDILLSDGAIIVVFSSTALRSFSRNSLLSPLIFYSRSCTVLMSKSLLLLRLRTFSSLSWYRLYKVCILRSQSSFSSWMRYFSFTRDLAFCSN